MMSVLFGPIILHLKCVDNTNNQKKYSYCLQYPWRTAPAGNVCLLISIQNRLSPTTNKHDTSRYSDCNNNRNSGRSTSVGKTTIIVNVCYNKVDNSDATITTTTTTTTIITTTNITTIKATRNRPHINSQYSEGIFSRYLTTLSGGGGCST